MRRVDFIMARRLARRVRAAREMSGLTQEELARLVRTHRPIIARMESGEHVTSLTVLVVVCRATKVPLSAMVAGLELG